jgi:hypothetical protein
MNNDRIVGTAVFGAAALAFFALATVKALTVRGFDVWDFLGGLCVGVAITALLFGWQCVARNLGIQYLIARSRTR